MPQEFAGRQAIDVSGAFDNCFFHAYAAHFLANGLPIPQELFTFESFMGPNSSASQLQKKFPNEESLSLFAEYAKESGNDSKLDPDFLVEKTLVLGTMMREWFAMQTLQLAQARTEDVVAAFEMYKGLGGKEGGAFQAETGALYESNEAFLEYCKSRPTAPKLDSLNPQELHFEQYFQNSKGLDGQIDQRKAFAAYWQSEGYMNYYTHFSKSGTKLSGWDVMPVVSAMQQPLAIINPGGGVTSNNIVSDKPPMELVIKDDEGHYFLVVTDETREQLEHYESSYKQYKDDRELFLDPSGKQAVSSESQQSLLVGAICPRDTTGVEPFDSLIAKVNKMQDTVEYAKRFQFFSSYVTKEIDNVLSTENKQTALIHYHREVEPIINQWLKFPSTNIEDQATLKEYKRLFQDIEKNIVLTEQHKAPNQIQESQGNPFSVHCSALTRDLDLLLASEDKKAGLAHYHKKIEPVINEWLAQSQTAPKDRALLVEYKEIFQDIELAVDQHMKATDNLRSQLEFKLHELVAYSDWLDETVQHQQGKKRTVLSGIDVTSEMEAVRDTMEQILNVLTHPVLNHDKASEILQDSIKASNFTGYKKSYEGVVSAGKSSVVEVKEELYVPPSNDMTN